MTPRRGNLDEREKLMSLRSSPLHLVHLAGNFMRVWSVYSMHRYLSLTGVSTVLFIFTCLIPSSLLFLTLQKPWKGRPLSNTQVVPSIVNGGVMSLYFITWSKGLMSNGPLKALMAEYSGAFLAVLSALLYGWTLKSHVWRKVGGLVAMMVAFYMFSQGWETRTHSPFDHIHAGIMRDHDGIGMMKRMMIAIVAGVLSALRRVMARRVSLKSQHKRRLHAITITSATCFLFPFAMWDFIISSSATSSSSSSFLWPYFGTVSFVIVLAFYVESIAEERLHIVFSTQKHLWMTGACVIVVEVMNEGDFSLVGFVSCCLILGLGMSCATSWGPTKAATAFTALLGERDLPPHPLPT